MSREGFLILSVLVLVVSAWAKKDCPSRVFIEQSLRDVHLPGAAIIVVNASDILYQEAFGYQSLSPMQMMDAEKSIFLLASLSKTFLGVAVMQLVETNRLDLDADINEYLSSSKPRLFHPKYPCHSITLRHLLSHSASIRVDQIIGLTFIKPNDSWSIPGTTLEDVCYEYLSSNVSNWLPEAPGSVAVYSNVGTALAALIVERVAQMPYEYYVREKILKPLSIDVKKAGYRLSDIERRDELVKQYAFNASSLGLWQQELPQINVSKTDLSDWLSIPFFSMTIYPAGLLRMSARSISVFLRMFMSDGVPLLSAASVTEMRKVVPVSTPTGDSQATVDNWRLESIGYGVIWSWRKASNGRRFIGHSGTIPGVSHSMLVNEQGTIGVIFLTNGDAYSNDDLTKKMGDTLADIRMSLFECFEN